MLTDLHVHLRPDDPEATAAEHFTAANAERYRERATELGIAELGVAEHIYRFSAALDIWEHPFWRRYASDDLDAYCSFVREETDLRLGIEADYVPAREDRLATMLEGREWDYVIGSIHFLRGDAIDMRGDWDIWRSADPEKVWRRYFETLGEAARTGMFDILAHPDLVKVWGSGAPKPEGDPRRFYELAMDGIADSDVTIEVSTAGLRKPADELYPAPALLDMAVDAGLPIALSSDAHVPEQLGHEYERAVELLQALGVEEIAVFERRASRLEALG